MFAPKTRYTWIPFQEYEINWFQRMVLFSLPLLKLLADVYAKTHMGLLLDYH